MIRYGIFLFFVISLVSCNKEKEGSEEFVGSMTALKNGVYWKSVPRNDLTLEDSALAVGSHVYNEKGYEREVIIFGGLPLEVGTYEVETSEYHYGPGYIQAWYGTSIDGGDVAGEEYNILNDSAYYNSIEISKVENQEVWGHFNITFFRDTTRGDPTSPDTLLFEDGSFHVKYSE